LSNLTKVEINPLFTLFFSIISHNYAPVNTKIKKSLINFKNFSLFWKIKTFFRLLFTTLFYIPPDHFVKIGFKSLNFPKARVVSPFAGK
jgi:hypothetical protein